MLFPSVYGLLILCFSTATLMPLDLIVGVILGMIETAFMLLYGETELPQKEEELVPARMGPQRTGSKLQ
jgi:MFS superfamily sulfate permease-like transporter